MTIKRRLFVSNIFMLLIPIIASIVVAAIIISIFFSLQPPAMENTFPQIYREIYRFKKAGDTERLKVSINDLNRRLESNFISIHLYYNGELINPGDMDTAIADKLPINELVARDISGSFDIDNMRVSVENAHNYSIVVLDRYPQKHGGPRPAINFGYTLPIIAIIVVLITNWILTRFMFKHIVGPLDILRNGVRQIRDGNLEHRIVYDGKDEFVDVCEDFNEMAVRLEASVAHQQRDENNRKELLAGISHDLRTPLTSIRAYVEGLLDGVAEDADTQLRYLQTVKTKASEIDSIVDKLFLFSKLDIGEFPFYPEKLDIGSELTAMLEAYGAEYESKGISLSLLSNVENVFINADPVQLRNAITNVLENSMKYCDKELAHIDISCEESDSAVILKLYDDGPGVPEESMGRLFDVFYRSDASRNNPSSGSGLGLAITAKILERLGGSIRAENAAGGGLGIIISLPKYVDSEAQS